ncbi:hypothetical protein [Agromyces sp. LHK192]|uniref:hypothetical protein n=1 Tax=Agromyces sp. LHK192 TaxID=2498704 RepID=UPI000FDBAA4D|nr:hypothetical protein [Agromyces sp. LHK192]
MAAGGTTIVEIADELYGLPANEFTAARNASAKRLRADDREAAARVAELRKPSASAWVVNQFARHRADELDELLALGAELRAAQDDLDAAALTALARERRALVTAMARAAASLAEELGQPVRDATFDEIVETLQAATTDASAAAAVRSGRLVRALETIGTEVDLAGAVSGGEVAASDAPARRDGRTARDDREGTGAEADGRSGLTAVEPVQEDSRFAARRQAERERAERAAAEAESRADAAEQAEAEASDRLAEARSAVDDASRVRDDLERRIRDLETQLAAAERVHAEAQRAVRPLEREHDRATRAAEEARAAADELRDELDDEAN